MPCCCLCPIFLRWGRLVFGSGPRPAHSEINRSARPQHSRPFWHQHFGHTCGGFSQRLHCGLYSIVATPILESPHYHPRWCAHGLVCSHFFYYIICRYVTHRSFELSTALHVFILISGIVVIGFLEVLFVVDTELMISRTSSLLKTGESLLDIRPNTCDGNACSTLN
jgi:hypothetical protein